MSDASASLSFDARVIYPAATGAEQERLDISRSDHDDPADRCAFQGARHRLMPHATAATWTDCNVRFDELEIAFAAIVGKLVGTVRRERAAR